MCSARHRMRRKFTFGTGIVCQSLMLKMFWWIPCYYHCCPVNGRVAALKATDSASLGAKRGVHDLNSEHSLEIFQGGSREHRQDPFCSIDGVSAVEDIR